MAETGTVNEMIHIQNSLFKWPDLKDNGNTITEYSGHEYPAKGL